MKITAIKTSFASPYKEVNKVQKTNIPHLDYSKKQSGAYIIKNTNTDKIVYIGYSQGNLYKTIYRHFEKWTDISREVKTRFTYDKNKHSVRVIFTTPLRAALLEKYLIMKIQPKDNEIKYLGYLTKTQVEASAEILDNAVFYTSNEKDFPF